MLEEFLSNVGISTQWINTYSPEMMNDHIMTEGIRSLMIEASLPKGLLAELAVIFIYLKNRFPNRDIKNEIPCTRWFGTICSVWYLKVIES